jgi:hypothetical protein
MVLTSLIDLCCIAPVKCCRDCSHLATYIHTKWYVVQRYTPTSYNHHVWLIKLFALTTMSWNLICNTAHSLAGKLQPPLTFCYLVTEYYIECSNACSDSLDDKVKRYTQSLHVRNVLKTSTLLVFIFIFLLRDVSAIIRESMKSSVMRVGSDTFGDPIFQKGLQI